MTDITLGGYPAKTCARAVHNDHTPGLVKPEAPADLQRIFDEGILFETEVTDWMRHAFEAAGPDLFVGTDNGPDGWAGNVVSTREAMQAGIDVIINGRLPSINGRSGAPDVLVKSGSGYLPVDIKGHQTLSKMSESPNPRSSVEVSRLVDPIARSIHVGQSNKGGHWRDDVIQLAHYTRMLQDLAMHAGDDQLAGGIVGTTDFDPILGDPYGIVWVRPHTRRLANLLSERHRQSHQAFTAGTVRPRVRVPAQGGPGSATRRRTGRALSDSRLRVVSLVRSLRWNGR